MTIIRSKNIDAYLVLFLHSKFHTQSSYTVLAFINMNMCQI
jgi:hypothetical protein